MLYLIILASVSFFGIVAMISIRLWQIKSGKIKTNVEGASFWAKTYKAVLIGESKIIDFLAKVFMFCGESISKLGLKQKSQFLLNKLFGGVGEKIYDIRKTVKGETPLSGEKENASEFLKDISNHKDGSKIVETTTAPVEKAPGE